MANGNGEEFATTNNSRPVSRPTPHRTKPATLFGFDRGRIDILGNTDEPIDVAWESDADTGVDDLP